MSRDRPSGFGDNEQIDTYRADGNEVCGYKTISTTYPFLIKQAVSYILPTSIEARVVGSQVDYSLTGEIVLIDPKIGFGCENQFQDDGRCEDYEVRFCCPDE